MHEENLRLMQVVSETADVRERDNLNINPERRKMAFLQNGYKGFATKLG